MINLLKFIELIEFDKNKRLLDRNRLLILLLLVVLNNYQTTECKLVWKVKPPSHQIAREYDNVRLNCEFEEQDPLLAQSHQYFVIWYKDGLSQNVLALNDKLANLNSSNYEIVGKYNLVIKNLTKNHSGLYTCQLFQSNDLVSSVNLTVLVPPKYAKINIKQAVQESPYQLVNKGYLVENDRILLECCTNSDSNPEPNFEWHKIERKQFNANKALSNHHYRSMLLTSNKTFINQADNKLCNILHLNLTRSDNDYIYKCVISNEAIINQKPVDDNILLSVEYKPEVTVHLVSNPSVTNRFRLIDNSSISLYCNSSALPSSQLYQWYFDDVPIKDQQTNTLFLKNLNKHQSGIFACKATNRHGWSKSSIRIEILYSKITALNRTLGYTESSNLRQSDAVYMNTFENSSLILTCQIDANPLNEKVTWYYYQINKDNKVINKVMLSNWISGSTRIINETQRYYYSQLSLINVTSNHSGYYSCSVQSKLSDDLGQNLISNSNSTYFLQVQYSPIVKAIKRKIHANYYDQVELSCEVKSNPQSIFSWYFGTKELFSNYKYNLTSTVFKQMHRAYMDDMDNIHHYRSTLVVNSLTQFDYGDYYCRANNIIGENGQTIKLKKKQKPDPPMDFKVVETTSNSAKLSWISGSNGGENSTYLISINNVYNLTTLVEENDSDEEFDNRYNLIDIRGLQSLQTYTFKILAFNSMGSSEYSDTIKTTTLSTSLKSDQLPDILNAQFNELREAICFELENIPEKSQFSNLDKTLKDFVVKIDVNLNDDLLNSVTENEIGRLDFNSNTSVISMSDLNATKSKTFLLSLNKLKYGQNCIPFSQIIELDWQLRNSSALLLQPNQYRKKQYNIYTINSALILNDPQSVSKLKSSSLSKLETLGHNFYEFKKLHNVNLSICYNNDSSICSSKINVKDYSPDFSTYVTLIAIGCSAILIFIVLLIASLCCCCCRRRQNNQKQNGIRKNDLNSKLVIKSFPIVSNQQGSYDYSDASCKSSQQHILNGSNGSTHSSGSSTYSRANEKIFYQTEQNIFDPNMPNKYGTNTYKIDFTQNLSSIATVESDTSSSTSLENKTTSTSNGKSSSNHSPFTLPSDNQSNSYFSSVASYPNVMNQHIIPKPSHTNTLTKPQSLLYSGSNNIYIKTYQQQQQQQAQRNLNNHDSPESGYSTPINTNNNPTTVNKKLVYEVIV